jgi:hypothetical protein
MITKVYYSVSESDSDTFGLPRFFYDKDCADFEQSLEVGFDNNYKDSDFLEIESDSPIKVKGALTKKEYIFNLKKYIKYGHNFNNDLQRIEKFITNYESLLREEKINKIIE